MMTYIKRFGLFILTNISVLIVFSLVLYVIEAVFGIRISAYGGGYVMLLIYCAIFGFIGAFISLAISKWMAKRAYGMKLISPENIGLFAHKEKLVYNTVRDLAERAHIKMPEVGIYEDQDPNAFATGMTKNSSLVAVSTGLLEAMDDDAIEGVIGHEMSHIFNGDMVTMTLLQGVLNTFVLFFAKIVASAVASYVDEDIAYWVRLGVDIALQIVFGILASLILMGFSRWREYRADAGSVRLFGKEKMIAGLEALQRLQQKEASGDPRFEPMQISGGKTSWFSSHPSLENRISAIEKMSV